MREEFRIVLLTRDHCTLCDQAKDVLNRVADDVPLAIETVDLDVARGREMATAGGVMFPPGVFIEGDPFSYGRLSERKLRKELARRAALR